MAIPYIVLIFFGACIKKEEANLVDQHQYFAAIQWKWYHLNSYFVKYENPHLIL